ncbi:MAG: NAD(P)/FAD-dependent oxidoreductase [Deltaproteobacteria bacterium]|nr:NAD(P)/FAD-dependent oxidoreductase [Deltaproteobacteria bacterium]
MPPEKSWSKHIPEGPWDCVVIGSGMGGMTTAALLAKIGQRVLVLEQHYVPGGFTHVFKRPGYAWDVGVHAVGEVTKKSMTGRLLAALTDGRLEWASLGPVYDEFHWPDGVRIDFPDTPQAFRANLEAAFPNESEAIHRYLNRVREVAGVMKAYYLSRLAPPGAAKLLDPLLTRKARAHFLETTESVLAELTTDPRLRSVLASQWGYYGSTPHNSSFAIQALVTKHFQWGAHYPVGGSGRIARELLRTVAAAGGWTAIRADVSEILIEGGRAAGVRLADGREVRAPRVISAAGVMSTLRRLLPEGVADTEWVSSVEELRPASAHVCLYLGFEGDIREAGASAANKWFYETWDIEADAWYCDEAGSRAPVLYCSFPSLKDPEHDPGPKVRHTGEVVTFVPWKSFAEWQDEPWKKRGAAYDEMKKDLEQRLLAQFFEHMPELEPMLRFAELSTPVSTQHFTRPIEGSIYGIEPTPKRFESPWLRPRSPIPGLLFSGSEVATVGVIGAMMGGVLAATSAEPLGALRYLRRHGLRDR